MHRKKSRETIDEKQDKVIEQLQTNQKELKSGLENIDMMNALPSSPAPIEITLPTDINH